MDTLTLFQYTVTASDVVITSIIIAISFSLWIGVFIYLFLKRGDKQKC